ncbi:MAG: ornithine cyclodeaminase [Caldilineae bacterium]|nr:MAG: ornithine cyclodeaminase [Caldilineae bacterium]
MRILSAADVTAALPMPAAIEAMRRAFGQLSAGEADVPLRARVATEKGVTLLMPAYLRQSRELGIKIVSVYGDNPSRGLPLIAAAVLVLDPETGFPRALMDGASLTALRTGAGGGLAADLLARKDARVVGLFGAGVQARAQLQAVMAVRSIERVYLRSRTRQSAERLAAEIATWPDAPAVTLADSPRQAVQHADIVIAATTSSTPVFDGHDLQPGTHVTGVGSFTPQMQEVDAVTVRRARVVVDSREACMAEAGDLIIPGAEIDAELGEIVNGEQPGRRSEEEITFFKSVGVAVQDAAAAAAVLAQAEARGLGTVVEL